MRSLLIGRFQPFHLGHLEAVRRIAASGEDLILAIGSAQESHTLKNPFTAGERWRMIEETLRSEGIRGVALATIPDVHRNAIWVRHVESLLPPFRVFYSNNALPSRLFREAGYEVRPIPFLRRAELSGTEIRRRIAAGEDWESLLPKPVAAVVREVAGDARIRDLLRDDSARRA